MARIDSRRGYPGGVRIDLHTHSTVSDGTEGPADVMRAAHAAGLDVIGLADHDSTTGWAEAAPVASELGLEFVPGIEVSCQHGGTNIHLLAFWPDPAHLGVQDMMARTRDARVDRAKEIVTRIAADYPIEWAEVAAQSGGADTVGRPHIADALVAAGHFPDRTAVFDEVLKNGTKYYVPHYAPEVTEATRALREAGGVPVFAHPGADARGRIVSDAVIEAMADAGLVGLEIDHRDHSDEQRERLAALGARLGLVRTGSSDYHGAGKPNRLGENLTTPENYESLKAAR